MATRAVRRAAPVRRGPLKRDLLRQYERATGLAASPRATNAWLSGEIAGARSRYNANRRAAVVQVAALATAAAGTYRRIRAEQASDPTKRSMGGDIADRINAGIGAGVAVAPGAALTALQGSANALAHGYRHLPFGLAFARPVSFAATAVTKVAGRAVLPALAAWSMHVGALEDTNALRGAARGLARAVDPTSILLGRGVAERAIDTVFGGVPKLPQPGFWDNANDPRFRRQPNAYERFWQGVKGRAFRSEAAASMASAGVAALPPRHLMATAALDRPHAATYVRTYRHGNKAGSSEIVRNTR